jgi:uncharacterized protein YacL
MIKETIEAFKSQLNFVYDLISFVYDLISLNPPLFIPFTIYIIIEMFLFTFGDTLLIVRFYQKIIETIRKFEKDTLSFKLPLHFVLGIIWSAIVSALYFQDNDLMNAILFIVLMFLWASFFNIELKTKKDNRK